MSHNTIQTSIQKINQTVKLLNSMVTMMWLNTKIKDYGNRNLSKYGAQSTNYYNIYYIFINVTGLHKEKTLL